MSKKDIKSENDVYFLGSKESGGNEDRSNGKKRWIVITVIIALIIAAILIVFTRKSTPDYYFEPETEGTVLSENKSLTNDTIKGYTEVLEETVNDVPMYVYIPHHAEMSLMVGSPDKSDSTIVFITQAADIRGDNKEIVGDFVLKGQKLSRGVAKTGFCAVINGNITLGVSTETPLLQQAVDSAGYFFRQYPLVDNGVLVENNPKNKSIRRALAIRSGKVIMVESRSAESFHDFSQALIDIGITDAIYLVGTNVAYGWYYTPEHKKVEFGVEQPDLENTSYIVWRSE